MSLPTTKTKNKKNYRAKQKTAKGRKEKGNET
jgi:hypothetical protein